MWEEDEDRGAAGAVTGAVTGAAAVLGTEIGLLVVVVDGDELDSDFTEIEETATPPLCCCMWWW